jgi:hypothetical protein
VKAVLPIAVSVVVLGKADPGRNRISGMSNGKNYPRKNENKGLPKQVKTQSKSIHMIPKDSIHCVKCD